MNTWELPVCAVFGGKSYQFHADFRDILEIFSYFDDPDMPEYLKWRVALALFYEEEIPAEYQQEAMAYLAEFLRGGVPEKPGAKLLDWQQDAPLIVADVNKVAGQEIRALPFLHWWSFLSWFHAIGQGQLSTVVSIRDKLRRGKPLEAWEKEFYREHKAQVELPKRYSRQELLEQEKLRQLLGEKI
jgi:hypothetical protein